MARPADEAAKAAILQRIADLRCQMEALGFEQADMREWHRLFQRRQEAELIFAACFPATTRTEKAAA